MLCSLSQSRCPLRERERERERELYLAGASCGALARDMAGTWTTRSLPHRAPRLPPGPRLGMMIGRCAPAARNALLPSLRKQVLARLRLCAVIVVRDFIESKLPISEQCNMKRCPETLTWHCCLAPLLPRTQQGNLQHFRPQLQLARLVCASLPVQLG